MVAMTSAALTAKAGLVQLLTRPHRRREYSSFCATSVQPAHSGMGGNVKAFRCVVAAASAVAAVVLAGCVTVIKARIAWLMCLGLLLLLTRSASADDLRKVEYWNYAHCVQENFFMADDERVLNESCQCYASEVTPFMSAEYQQAVINHAFPYKGPKPISDTMLGIVLMARCPATTPLVEKMWCGPSGENPAWCKRFVHVRSGIFGGPEPWPAAPERGSAKVLAALTQSCLKDSGATGASEMQESCACFARETAPFPSRSPPRCNRPSLLPRSDR
jgi:hypothetical protein